MRSREETSKLIFTSCVGYFDRAHYDGFWRRHNLTVIYISDCRYLGKLTAAHYTTILRVYECILISSWKWGNRQEVQNDSMERILDLWFTFFMGDGGYTPIPRGARPRFALVPDQSIIIWRKTSKTDETNRTISLQNKPFEALGCVYSFWVITSCHLVPKTLQHTRDFVMCFCAWSKCIQGRYNTY